jgi:hypothetical protein
LRSPPLDLISVPYAGKSLGHEKAGLPFRATPGHGWAGFMNYRPNIKLVTGGRQGYESTMSTTLCRQQRPPAMKKLAVDPSREGSVQPYPEYAGAGGPGGRAKPRGDPRHVVIVPALTNHQTGHKIRHQVLPSLGATSTMDVQHETGETAGRVWRTLSDERLQTVAMRVILAEQRGEQGQARQRNLSG